VSVQPSASNFRAEAATRRHNAQCHNPYYSYYSLLTDFGKMTVAKLVKSTTVLPCYMCPLLDHILSQLNPVHILTLFKWPYSSGSPQMQTWGHCNAYLLLDNTPSLPKYFKHHNACYMSLPPYTLNLITLNQRFSNCGPRTTSGPRVLPLWSF